MIVLLALVAFAAGIHLGWIDRNQAAFRAFPWLKTGVGLICAGAGDFPHLLVGHAGAGRGLEAIFRADSERGAKA